MTTILRQIDGYEAARLNRSYYTSDINSADLHFFTYAMYNGYQAAVAKYLYHYIENFKKNEKQISILELGAHGVYFEEGVYREFWMLDMLKNANLRGRVEYRIVDISQKSIELAEKTYESASQRYFVTKFFVNDVIQEELPPNNDIIIMNELLDDLTHKVIVRTENGELQEAVFDLECIGNKTWLSQNGFKRIEGIPEKDLLRIGEGLGKGEAITYSAEINPLFDNIARNLKQNGLVFVHDYFVKSASRANGLKRPYGSITCDKKEPIEGKVQITSDVNFGEVVYAMEEHGFELIMAIPTEDFIYNTQQAYRPNAEGSTSRYLNIAGIKRT